MDVRKAMRRSVPLVLLGAAATVMLRKRLLPRPALPPGTGASAALATDVAAATSAAIAEQSAAVIATADVPVEQPGAASPGQAAADPVFAAATAAPARAESRFARRLRRAPIDIVTVVDDLLSAAR